MSFNDDANLDASQVESGGGRPRMEHASVTTRTLQIS